MQLDCSPARRAGTAPVPGHDEVRVELGERLEREAPLVQARVRHGQARLVDLLVAVEEQVEVDRARAEARAVARRGRARARSRAGGRAARAGASSVSTAAAALRNARLVDVARRARSRGASRRRRPRPGLGASSSSAARSVALAVAEVRAEADVGASHQRDRSTVAADALDRRSPAGPAACARARALPRGKALEQRVGDARAPAPRAAGSAAVGDLADARGDVAVVDRVLDPVARAAPPTSSYDVEERTLALALLLLEHAVVPEDLEPVQLDRSSCDRASATASASTCLAHVVDAQDRRAALVGGDGGGEARRERAGRRVRVAEQAAERALAREADETGRPSASRTSRRRTSSKLCSTVLPKPIPGSRQIRSSAMPGGDRERRAAPRGTRRPRRRRRRSAGRPASSAARRSMCIRQRYAPASATTPASSGSPRSAVTSLTSSAPSASARRATSAFDVSIETGRAGEPLEHGHDAPQLLVERHALRAGPGRLAADVDDRRALRRAIAPRGCDRVLGRAVDAAVRERVRRDVDDAHHGRARESAARSRSRCVVSAMLAERTARATLAGAVEKMAGT